MASSSGGNFAVWSGLYAVYQIWELDGVLDEEHGDIVADNIKVALVGITLDGQSLCHHFDKLAYNLVAKPWTSLTVSELPLDPATVEKRIKIGVCFPSFARKEAPVILLKSP